MKNLITQFREEIKMLTDFLFELKNWWFGESFDETEEFERLESKHTRVHHDQYLNDIIRVH